MKNYIRIKKNSLIFNYYAYIDTEDFFADDIFEQEKLRVFWEKVGTKKDSQYLLVLCKVWKWDDEKFGFVMEKFYKKMLLLGHGECIKFFDEIGVKEVI